MKRISPEQSYKGDGLETLPHEKQIDEYHKTIERLKAQNEGSSLFNSEIVKLEKKLETLKEQVYTQLSPWERVQICRHPSRPHSVDYISTLFDDFHPLAGDRLYGEDAAIIGGLGTIGGFKCVVIGQEKGSDTESRLEHNFGMLNPEGFRKALRLMRLAEKFGLPIVSFLDTPGALPGLGAEERGQGWAIATNLREMATIETPIIVVVIGEGCSGGALGMGVGDVIGMLQHAYYSVISPEGCASILWKDASMKHKAAETLRLTAEHLLEMQIIDAIIEEPLGGAHHDPKHIYENVKKFILNQMEALSHMSAEQLVEERYQKFRRMGKVVEADA